MATIFPWTTAGMSMELFVLSSGGNYKYGGASTSSAIMATRFPWTTADMFRVVFSFPVEKIINMELLMLFSALCFSLSCIMATRSPWTTADMAREVFVFSYYRKEVPWAWLKVKMHDMEMCVLWDLSCH